MSGLQPYGLCPHCKAPGVSRERRPNGNDTCEYGHVYPSRSALASDKMPSQLHTELLAKCASLPTPYERLQHLHALTTPGVWKAKSLMVQAGYETVVHFGTSNSFRPPRPSECEANAAFLAQCHEDLPVLLQEIRELREALQEQHDARKNAGAR